MKNLMKKLSILYVVFAGISWGTAGLFIRPLSKYGFNSFQLASARCIVAVIAALIFTILTNKKSLKITPIQLLLFLVSGTTFYAMATLYYMSMQAASISTAAVLLNMAPVIVMVVSLIFLGEQFSLRKGVAMFIALLGCALVTGLIGGMRFDIAGIIYGLLSALCYATYSICVNLAVKKGSSSGTTTLYSFLFAALVSFIFSPPDILVNTITDAGTVGLVLIISFGIVTGFLASFLYSQAMKKLPAGLVSALAAIEPLTQTILSIVVLGEVLTIASTIGICLILASVVTLSFEV